MQKDFQKACWEHAQFGKRHQGCGDDDSGLATKRAIRKYELFYPHDFQQRSIPKEGIIGQEK
jgi:hypothetical protein